MQPHEIVARITIDPNMCFGKATIRRTRIWVGLVLDLLGHGVPVDQHLDEHPSLTDDDIWACLAYGAKLSTGRYADVA